MRIGIDASVVPATFGGTRSYILSLLPALAKVRPQWKFTLYIRENEPVGNWVSDAIGHVAGVQVRGSNPFSRTQVHLPRRLNADGVDLLHSPGYFLPLRWSGPKVVTIHDLNMYYGIRGWLRPRTLPTWLVLASETPLSIMVADRIITDSRAVKRQLCMVLRQPEKKVVPIPLAPDRFYDEPPAKIDLDQVHGVAGEMKHVLYVGVLSPQKNLSALLTSYASSCLPERGSKLILVGPDVGRYGQTLARRAQHLGIGEKVLLLGFVPRPTLRALYHEALCCVLPSHREGFGLPLVEAMACGAPVLAADRQAMPEVLGTAGALFDPRSKDELTELLDRISADSGFEQALRQASYLRRQDFSWERTAAKTVRVYEDALG